MKLLIGVLSISAILNATPIENLNLNKALKILKEKNLEFNVAKLDEKIKKLDAKMVKSLDYGKLNLNLNAIRSNDAGNVFGFKLHIREVVLQIL